MIIYISKDIPIYENHGRLFIREDIENESGLYCKRHKWTLIKRLFGRFYKIIGKPFILDDYNFKKL